LFVLSLAPCAAGAQFTIRSWLDWRTIETEHFALHYPSSLEVWTRDLATRIESIDSSVSRLVGHAPSGKTDVVVDDPYETANGSAWPYLGRPVINLWASVPDPRDEIGEFRQWNEMLASHEFAHVAHLSRPSRNAVVRRLWTLSPANLSPIAVAAPRWVIEGYATFAEGRVTGSGRPHGTWRAAYLRQWALEGQLPRYEQLNSWGAYEGGAFAYLAGSAFLEWLSEQHGDSSLVDVWRRLSAKQQRTFDQAFSGVYGESARALYGRFSAELTSDALSIERRLRAAGSDTGTIVQRTSWSTGDPAISPDGQRVALVLRSATAPSRVVIWRTASEPDTSKARRDSILLERDPEDVPGKSIYPPPKRVLASLRSSGGSPYEAPRFLNDGRVLLWRRVSRGDGSLTSDLYLWDPARRTVRRVTRDASLREADPTPDGRSAVAEQCIHGWCDVVVVDLANGAIRKALEGSPARSFFKPRVSSDGRSAIVSVATNGRWRLAVFPLEGASSQPRFIDPNDGANRYDASFIAADTVLAVSDAGGIANLERLDVGTGATHPLTHVTGAAVAPVYNPRDRSVWFLSLYSRGYDVRRVERATSSATVVAIDSASGAAAPAPTRGVHEFAVGAVSSPRPFGLSPRLFRWIPQPQLDAGGASVALGLISSDLISRSEVLLTCALGSPTTSRGAAASFTWRGFRPAISAVGFVAEQRPSASRSGVSPPILDHRMSGATIEIDATEQRDTWSSRTRLAASASTVASLAEAGSSSDQSTSRALAFFDFAVGRTWRGTNASLTANLGADETAGRSFDQTFARSTARAGVTVYGSGIPLLSASALYGAVSRGAPGFENFAIGGGLSPVLARELTTQWIAMPALPKGVATGPSVFAYKATLNASPFAWYLWSASTADLGSRFSVWHRVVGVEYIASIARIPLAGTPAARAQIGVGRSLDAPYRNKTRAYLSFILNP
jgi:Tol biopolymer transport system component